MILYKYEFIDGKTERTQVKEYPEMDILARGLAEKRNADLIKMQYLEALEGQEQEALIKKEEEWFFKNTEVQEALRREQEILDLINGTEDILDLETEEVLKKGIPKAQEPELTELNKELQELKDEEIITETGIPDEPEVQVKPGKITSLLEERESLEKDSWLKTYRGEGTEPRPEVKKPQVQKKEAKELIKHERDLNVRTAEDSIADLAKMNALLMSFVTAIYSVTPDEAKDELPKEQKAIIDYATSKWMTTETRGDRQLATEGTNLIDKLFEREVKIADIVDKHKRED